MPMLKKLLFIFTFFLSFSMFSQHQEILIHGKVKDSLRIVKGAHVYNLSNKKGTFTNEDGAFKMLAALGDKVLVSSVQHFTDTVTISAHDLKVENILIRLRRKTYELDEVVVKNHNLKGVVDIDYKKTPKDRRAEALRMTMDFSNIDMTIVEPDDHIDKKVRPPIVNTDPNMNFFGAGAAIGFAFKHSERLWALRRKLARKASFPGKLLNELGEDFFFKELKIPVERYYHFLDYCSFKNIEELHKDGRIIEVIKILQEEQKEYLKIIQKD